MKFNYFLTSIICFLVTSNFAQTDLPTDYLSSDFHKGRRSALRNSMPNNSVAIFFANPVRNRANDVDYVYHQDPNFYYLTGYNEPNTLLLIFSDDQTDGDVSYNEMIYVRKRHPQYEMWTGRRLGVEGVSHLGFDQVFNGEDFESSTVDFLTFDKVLFKDFENDVRDSKRDKADLYNLI